MQIFVTNYILKHNYLIILKFIKSHKNLKVIFYLIIILKCNSTKGNCIELNGSTKIREVVVMKPNKGSLNHVGYILSK